MVDCVFRFQVVFEMKKKQIAEKKQEQDNIKNSKREQEEKNFRIEDGVAVADLLDLETELENIQQVDNQLQNIPLMSEVNWPSNGSAEQDPFNDTFFTPAPAQAASQQNGFWSQPPAFINAVSLFELFFESAPSSSTALSIAFFKPSSAFSDCVLL